MKSKLLDHLSTPGRSVFSDSVATKLPIVARCNCCKIDYMMGDFETLEYVGIQKDDTGKACIEYRNCPCGSTIGRDLEKGE